MGGYVSLLSLWVLSLLMTDWIGVGFMLFACSCLFIGVQLMFEYRYVVIIPYPARQIAYLSLV